MGKMYLLNPWLWALPCILFWSMVLYGLLMGVIWSGLRKGLCSLACSFSLLPSSQGPAYTNVHFLREVWTSPLVIEKDERHRAQLPQISFAAMPGSKKPTPSWPPDVCPTQMLIVICHWDFVVVCYGATVDLYGTAKGSMTQKRKELCAHLLQTGLVCHSLPMRRIHLRFRRWEGRRGHYFWEGMCIIHGSFLRHSNFTHLFTNSHFTDRMTSQISPWTHKFCPTLGGSLNFPMNSRFSHSFQYISLK